MFYMAEISRLRDFTRIRDRRKIEAKILFPFSLLCVWGISLALLHNIIPPPFARGRHAVSTTVSLLHPFPLLIWLPAVRYAYRKGLIKLPLSYDTSRYGPNVAIRGQT